MTRKLTDFSPLATMAKAVHAVAASKGFHDQPVPVGDSVSNLHGEVSELWEAYRMGKINEHCDKADRMRELDLPVLTCLEEELADILIRVLDTSQEYGVDISRAVAAKNAYNQTRPHRNGGKLA